MQKVICFLAINFLFPILAFTTIDNDYYKFGSGKEKSIEAILLLGHQIVRRAAFDIGSGQIKMQVAGVDLATNKIVNVLLTDASKCS